jgi:hypothetical protein
MDADGVASTSDSDGELVNGAEDRDLGGVEGPDAVVVDEQADEAPPDSDELQDTCAATCELSRGSKIQCSCDAFAGQAKDYPNQLLVHTLLLALKLSLVMCC